MSSSNWSILKSLVVVGAMQVASAPMPQQSQAQDSKSTYSFHSLLAAKALTNNWYNKQSGLWDNLWWNSGNALTILADFTQLRPTESGAANTKWIIGNTFTQAQKADVKTKKVMGNQGMATTQTCINGQGNCTGLLEIRDGELDKRLFKNFINTYYDDEGWWALGLIRSYDATHDKKYLDAAVSIFRDMRTGLGGPCHGGIYWSKDRSYVNAIANELYLSVAASLANRIPKDKPYFLRTAKEQWNWFEKSGMINKNNLINDGLDANCKNNGGLTWSYNQGVVLGGLTELYRATGDRNYLKKANSIAHAAIKALSNKNGILVEVNKCEFDSGHCGQDAQQFKGIFIRNLRYLYDNAPNADFRTFILRNADAIWKKDHDGQNRLGASWDGPYFAAKGPSHSSAMDVLISAIAVA